MVKVAVRNVGRCRVLTKRKVERIVRTVIKSHGVSRAECSVTFLSDSAIKRLNRIYFKRNRPTDVIAFKLDEGVRLKGDEGILGDIVISVDRARESRDALAKLGVPASYREYEMGHEISPDALRQLISWLDEKVVNPVLLA